MPKPSKISLGPIDFYYYKPLGYLSNVNQKLRNDKTISNYLQNNKHKTLAGIARMIGYGLPKKRKRRKTKR